MLKVGRSGIEAELHMIILKKPILNNNARILPQSFWDWDIMKSRFDIHGGTYPPTLHLCQALCAVRYGLGWDLAAGVSLHYVNTCPEVLSRLAIGD